MSKYNVVVGSWVGPHTPVWVKFPGESLEGV